MRKILGLRLNELEKEFEKGQIKLRDLQMQQSHLQETLLRISGAITVLKEILEEEDKSNRKTQAGVQFVETESVHASQP